MATRVVTVNDVLDGHVGLDLECFDRIYLNGWVPTLQVPGQVVSFLTQHLGFTIPSPALLDRIGLQFRKAVAAFAAEGDIPVTTFVEGQRNREVMGPTPEARVMVLAPIVRGRKGEFKKEIEKLVQHGFTRARIDGELLNLEDDIPLDKRKNHTIEVVIDRLLVKPGIEHRLELSVGLAMKLAGGLVQVAVVGGDEQLYSAKLACPDCGISVPQLEPRSLSVNSPYGECDTGKGRGAKDEGDAAKINNEWARPM